MNKQMLVTIYKVLLLSIILIVQLGCSSQSKKSGPAISNPEKIEFDESDSPLLKSPKVKKYWQQDKIEGKKFIKGHWVYEIEEQSIWIQ